MDWQTFLNIILALLAAYLAFRNYAMAMKKENQRESQEMTEIRVQLTQVMGLLRDLQKDMKNVTVLSERVVVIETRLTEIFGRLEKLEDHANGKQQ